MIAATLATNNGLQSALAMHGRQELRALTWWTVSLPLRSAIHHASAHEASIESIVIAADFDGWVGHAEVRANGSYATGETNDDIEAGFTNAVLLGSTVTDATDSVILRSRLAAMAIDIAGWDALGRRLGKPVHQLLGSSARQEVCTHAQIGFGDVETAAVLASRFLRQGFTRLKVRVGAADEQHDLARLRAIRDVGGPDISLVADANGGWSEEQALAALPYLHGLGIDWLEQPVSETPSLALITARQLVKVRADESVRGTEDVVRLANTGAVDGVHLKLEKSGTLSRLTEAIDAAQSRGLHVAIGQMDQGRLGCAATTQLAAGLGFPTAELWGWAEVVTDVADPLTVERGAVQVPQGPGLGVKVAPLKAPKGTL